MDRHALPSIFWCVVGAGVTTTLAVSLFLHPVPLYATETDFVGEYVPAARALAAIEPRPEQFATKGPGYPIMLALVSPLTGGDFFLAGKLINAAAFGVCLTLVAFLCMGILSSTGALLAIGCVLLNPTVLRAAIEVGTDMPAMALALGAMFCAANTKRSWSAP